MGQDWKAALAALNASGSLPAGDEGPAAQAPEPEKVQKAPLRIYIDRRARRGKEATVIEGFLCTPQRVKEIASELKRTLGCGGSVRDDEILLQGDVRDKTGERLEKLGFRTKLC